MKDLMSVIIIIIVTILLIQIYIFLLNFWRHQRAKPLIQALNDKNLTVRRNAVEGLGKIGGKNANSVLLQILEDDNALLRATAAQSLGRIGDDSALPFLVRIASHDTNPDVREAAVNAIQSFGEKIINEIETRRRQANILGQLTILDLDKLMAIYVLPSLSEALQDSDDSVRNAAIVALKEIGTTSALETLEKAVSLSDTDTVQFSAYFPPRIVVKTRYSLIVYAHLKDKLQEISRDIQKFKDELGGELFPPKSTKQTAQLKPGTPITIVPECDDATFDPLSLTKEWRGDWVRFNFDFLTTESMREETLFVRISIQLNGGIEIAHIKCPIEVLATQPISIPLSEAANPLAAAKSNCRTSELYQNIFVSYSREDKEIVEVYRLAQLALGNDVFVDTYSIRTGENWRAALARAIDKSDIFQLFWSKHSAMSPNVRDEWKYALLYKCPQDRCETFIRPIFWVHPISEPPKELEHLNFKFVPFASLQKVTDQENKV